MRSGHCECCDSAGEEMQMSVAEEREACALIAARYPVNVAGHIFTEQRVMDWIVTAIRAPWRAP